MKDAQAGRDSKDERPTPDVLLVPKDSAKRVRNSRLSYGGQAQAA